MNIVKKILLILMTLCLSFALLILSFRFVCFYDNNFLSNLYEKYDVYDDLYINVSKADVNKLTKQMMDYLNNKEENLSYNIIVDNSNIDFFSERTKIHFYDVKVLMNNLKYIAYIALVLSIVLIFVLKNKITFKEYLFSLIIVLVIYVFFIGCIAINFDSFFITFHKIFFKNDYWILDPRYDYIISLLPEELFKDITIKILTIYSILMIIVSFCLKILFRPEAK